MRDVVKRWASRRKVNHYEAMPYQEVPAAYTALGQCQAMRETRLAMQFMILTATRGGETRGATWAEIDLDASVWTIPGNRMKGGIAHRVPLTLQAKQILRLANEAVAKRRKRKPSYNPNGLSSPTHPATL